MSLFLEKSPLFAASSGMLQDVLWWKMIARALQEYGMILVDTSGALKIYVEDLVNNPFAREDWADPQLNLTKESIYNIPYTAFRVLELPPGYWESSENAVYQGKCISFPK